ncbi:MAG: hypothetical protein KBS86_02715 [Proteobacteria bacterium]|nr:hypothetical protein [Candidatus Enterousia scatequi]
MKYILCPSVALILSVSNAFAGVAPVQHLYANSVVGANIINIQNTVAQSAIDRFDGRINFNRSVIKHDVDDVQHGADVYGTMRPYGEYGDDGTVFGRNGGDTAVVNDVWVNWNYANGYIDFDKLGRVDTRSNIIMAGASDDLGFGNFGVFGGYVGGDQVKGAGIDVSENAGFVGVFDGFRIGDFSIDALADAGVMFSKSKMKIGDDNFNNIWIGTGVNLAYDIRVDNTFYIQPSVYGGYTWIRAHDYTSLSGDHVTSQNFNSLNLIPGLRFVKNIIGDWYGTAGVKYVMSSNHGGVTDISGRAVENLDYGNHTEYAISIERHIESFDLSVNIGRYDGAYTGWQGGASIKYVF